MAQLKDSVVSGNLRVTDTTLTDTLQVTTIKAPTSSNETTYGPGTSGQVLTTNGTSTYWGAANNHTHSYIPTSAIDITNATNIGLDAAKNGFGYVNNVTKADWNYQQKDGALIRQVYSDLWKLELFGDYRTGHLSVRGKNNGTWQNWLRILDEGNYTSYTVKKDGTGATGSWGISITGNAANVTGTVAIANGGTGATTRLAALRALTEQDVGTSAQYFLTITNSWGKGGYTSVANAKTVLGLKSAAYTESSDYVPNTQAGVIDAINLLSTGSSTPSLADYYVSQYANGGTTSTSYHRRPISSLWNAFKELITLTTTGSGNAVTDVSIANDGDHNRKITVTKGSTFSLSTHTHGLLHSNLNQTATNGTTGGWSVIGIDPAVTGYVLKSIRVNTTSPNWLSGDYGAGIAFGGSDTKGVISMKYQSPVITFAGGSHNSSKTEPTWYLKISGTSGSTYNLANFYDSTISRTANTVLAAPNGSNGGATFRKLVAADIPALSYVPINGKAPNGIGRDGYVAYATDGFLNTGTGTVTGALVITTPFTKTKGEVMLKFTVDIYNYKSNTSVEYKVSGYAFSDGKWYNCTAYCVSSGVYSADIIDNLTVRFGYVTDGFYKVQIGETTTNKWQYPRINIHDITVAYTRSSYTDANSGWSVEFVTSGNIPNITQTITNTAQQITPISVTSSTLDTTPGTFAFFGSGAPWTGTDWCGLQVGFQDDRFQIVASNGTLSVRQNDSSGTPTTAGWSEWKTLSTTDHTHSYIPLSGSTSVTGKIGFSAINTGIWLKDASGIQVGALVDNGSNLWIGAAQSTLRHHKGETFISSGWSGTLPTTASSSLTGNATIKISVPVYTVDANGNGSWNHTGYPVLHSGNYTSYTVKKDGTGATGSWGISITGNAANVTGTVAIAHGGTGATTRLGALRALTEQNVGTSAQYFLTITDSWGKGGYTSVADAKTVLGLGSAAYTSSTAYLSSSTKYAGSSSVGGAANSSNVLNSNTRMDYGWDGVNYFNINGTAGNAAKVNDTPTTAWWHIMRFNHNNNAGYYTDLAIPFNTTSLYYKRITGGSVQNGGWVKVLDALNVGYVMSSVIKYDPHARRFTSSKTDSAWNAQAYSNTGYADNVYVSFRAGQTTMYAMIGLDANPSEDANYDKIDYCWYIQNNGALKVYESGTAVTITGHTTYASGDEFRVEYSCGEIRYYHNGTMCRSVTRAVSGKLFFDSSFYNAGNVYDFSYGTSTHSTHTAEIITSTYKSTSFVTSLTSSVITLSDAASSFGGWICGPTKNGRIAISSYQGSDDKLYFGYGERGRTTNSYVKAMKWDGPTNTLTADKFVGDLQGNATRANYINVVAGNEIRFYNDNQFKANNQFWIGYGWADGSHYTPSGGSDTSSTTAPNITKFIMGNCSAGGLASVHAKTFILGNGSSPTHTSKTTTIATAATTTDRTITLPDASGTIAVFPAARTSGQVVITDGTAGAVKTSGYTIAKSVPSNAVFTDTKVTQTITTASNDSYRPILVGMDYSGTNLPTSYTGTTKTDKCYATHKVLIQPSTGDIYATSLTLKSASTGSVTLKAASQTTSGTYYLPACGNGTYTLSIGMTQVGGTGDSLVMSNISGIPSGTLSFKIIFRSNASLPIYSMVEIPNIGDGVDCGGLIQVGDYTDGQQGSLRIVMKSVVIRVTAGKTTGTKTFTATVSPTQKISGSSVSEFTRNVIMYKIYACC